LARGWTDALRELRRGAAIYTFWTYFGDAFERNDGIRIDHILLNRQVASRLTYAPRCPGGVNHELPAVVTLRTSRSSNSLTWSALTAFPRGHSMMDAKLQADVRFLKAYSALTTVLLVVIACVAAGQANRKPKFEEIDVERINIVDSNGKLRMVIANGERQHPGVVDGKTLSRKRPPGMIFFNERGDECGGLSFDGNEKDGKASAGALLAFDRFRQDQTVGIQYGENNGRYYAGLRVWDRPDTSLGPVIEKLALIEKMKDGPEKAAAVKALRELPGGAERLMVGRDRDQSAVVRLADTKGRIRIKLWVDVAGVPKIEFLDETGKVTYHLPPENQADKP
jgi:hypothetical protein